MSTTDARSTAGAVVWLLTIGHRHGHDTTVHHCESAAREGLLGFVAKYWGEVVGLEYDTGARRRTVPEQMPADSAAAIDIYFAAHDGEWFDIAESKVG